MKHKLLLKKTQLYSWSHTDCNVCRLRTSKSCWNSKRVFKHLCNVDNSILYGFLWVNWAQPINTYTCREKLIKRHQQKSLANKKKHQQKNPEDAVRDEKLCCSSIIFEPSLYSTDLWFSNFCFLLIILKLLVF